MTPWWMWRRSSGATQPLPDVRALLETGQDAIARVGDALAGGAAAPKVALADVRLRAPILQPHYGARLHRL